MEKSFSLKDLLFNKDKIAKIADEISQNYSAFDNKSFQKKVLNTFPELELKQRITWISENLRTFLPNDYQEAVNILLKSLPSPNDNSKTDNDFGDFIYAPYAEFIARYGCNKQNLAFSLHALKEITMRFSAEDAIRYFINAFPDETINELYKWSKDSHYHVRRLTSEGTRPKLPWSQKISISPEKALPILNNLYCDKTRFVTRSVANHLNDISKINPELTLETLQKWQKEGKQNSQEMDFIVNHSLRTLVKQGNKKTIEFLRYSADPQIIISDFKLKEQNVILGTNLEFSFTITSQKDERLIVDYILHFQNKAGQMNNKKVFKLKQIELKKGQRMNIAKKHKFIKEMTTRKVYTGVHKIDIQINGKKFFELEFNVIEK